MSLLNDIGKKIGNAAETTSAKAKEQLEIAKLNSAISGEEKKLDKLFAELGRQAFENENGNASGPYYARINEIIEAQSSIAEYRAKIGSLKDSEKPAEPSEPVVEATEAAPGPSPSGCPGCGKENLSGTKFCSECGARLQ